MKPIQALLGPVVFTIDTADINQMTYNFQYNLIEQSRPLADRALVYPLDEASSTLQFRGAIYPASGIGSPATLPTLRAMARAKLSYFMVLGTGQQMGMWYVNRIEEVQSHFHDNGQPRKTEFTLTLKYHDDLEQVMAEVGDFVKDTMTEFLVSGQL